MTEPHSGTRQTVSVNDAYRTALDHHRAGRLDEAEQICRQLVARAPEFPDAPHLLGLLLHQTGRTDEALGFLGAALELSPGNPAIHFNIGNALKAGGDLEPAVAHYRSAIEIAPGSADVHNNLGTTLRELGDLARAEAHFRSALEIHSDHAETHSNLGAVLIDLGRFEDAEAACRCALSHAPTLADGHYNLGNALRQQHRLEDAIGHYREAVRLRPGLGAAHNNMANALVSQGRLPEAWPEYQHAIELSPDNPVFHSNLVHCLHYDPANDGRALYDAARAWADRHGAVSAPPRPHPNVRDPDRKLKIGYVSPDFRRHSVAWFALPFLKAHDPAAFEVTCYYNSGIEDAVTAECRAASHNWRSIFNLPDAAAAEMIRTDEIDILVDLAGHTMKNRLPLFAREPAPLQVSYLGFPGTTGLEAMDTRLTDRWADPDGEESQWHTEQLVRLDGGFLCYRPPDDAPAVGPAPARASGHITFGSFNALAKTTSEVVALWARVLSAVPGSRLLLKTMSLGDPGACVRTRELFADHGIGDDRLVLTGFVEGTGNHLAAYHRVDIALDTFPYNGTTTTAEALWMGVPVVTLAGDRHAARVGSSLLHMAGLEDLIADTGEGFVDLAASLAHDPDRLQQLRASMRDRLRASKLLDAPAFTRTLEDAYRHMWRTWCIT